MIIHVITQMRAHAEDVTITVYNNDFETDQNAWRAYYGGKVSVSTVSKSLNGISEETHAQKMINRTKSWHSPGINIYNIAREYEPAKYTFSMNVMVKGLDTDSHNIGLLVRTAKKYSFINIRRIKWNNFYGI